MGNNYVAHDYLHGRGDAAISIALLTGLIMLFLALYFGYNGVRGSRFVSDKVHGFLREDKAPPEAPSATGCKTREEMREEQKLKRKREKEEKRKAIKEYIDIVMVPFLDDNKSLDLLEQNIRHWHFSDESNSKDFKPEPLNPNSNITSWDIRHFVWNIGKRLGWEGKKMAKFARYSFKEAMEDLEIDTIRRTLRQKGPCTIKIDVPNSKKRLPISLFRGRLSLFF